MSAVRSFIVRIYRRRGSRELSGTLEPVDTPHGDARPLLLAFANDAELLGLMHAGPSEPSRPLRGQADPAPEPPAGRDRQEGGEG